MQATDVAEVVARIKSLRAAKSSKGVSIGFHGNVVALWEALAKVPCALVCLMCYCFLAHGKSVYVTARCCFYKWSALNGP